MTLPSLFPEPSPPPLPQAPRVIDERDVEALEEFFEQAWERWAGPESCPVRWADASEVQE